MADAPVDDQAHREQRERTPRGTPQATSSFEPPKVKCRPRWPPREGASTTRSLVPKPSMSIPGAASPFLDRNAPVAIAVAPFAIPPPVPAPPINQAAAARIAELERRSARVEEILGMSGECDEYSSSYD